MLSLVGVQNINQALSPPKFLMHGYYPAYLTKDLALFTILDHPLFFKMGLDMPIVSFICAISILILLPLHWRTRNYAVLLSIIWIATTNLIRGINSAIWANNTDIKYEIWCDINTKLIIGGNFALPATGFCVCRFLAQVGAPPRSIPDASDKRRRARFDIDYVVQGHRFDIIEEIGCIPYVYQSVAGLLIVRLPSLLVSLGGLVYAGIALHWFVYRRAQFQQVLQSTQSGLTKSLYLRFISLSVIEMVYTTTMSLFIFVNSVRRVRPWASWDDVHLDWYRIDQYSREIYPPSVWNMVTLSWYSVPIASVLFIAFFGFGQEARAEYVKVFRWLCRTNSEPPTGLNFSLELASLSGIAKDIEATSPSTRVGSRAPFSDGTQVKNDLVGRLTFSVDLYLTQGQV
ncbi:Pheromone B beta 1 receptor [Ceratobasidium theobromae]|uniref:Pheromone B beta 1 receptor n=1 Tax=Ceratobasidium theobromae TaxID=1582974 RepID=A0A5N5QAL0_9AGAM|nr:Pheromone B beta 1 receptor [Ceratobasidium theobromae]